MTKVWTRLMNEGIPFLSIHDEIMTRVTDSEKAREIFCQVLGNTFDYFKLNETKPPAKNTPLHLH